MRTSLLAVLFIAALGAGAAAGYVVSRQAPAAPAPAAAQPAAATAKPRAAVPVEVVTVTEATLEQRLNAVGTLVSEESVMLRPEIAGRIREVPFVEGQAVKRGDVLLRLDDSIARAELQQAQANFGLAESKFKRADELQREGFISRQGRDEASNTLQVERANVALARARLDKTVLRAPFDGEIGLRTVSVGDYVTVGQDLVTLQAARQLKVDFRIPELYLAQIAPGQRLDVGVDALPGRTWPARVTAISPLVDVSGRALVMRAIVDNADGTLRPGMFARVNLLLSETPALLVPETALAPRDNRQYVYRVRDGVVSEVAVRIGQRRGGQVEIVEGLNDGDQIVTAGLQKIQDGTRVAATLAPST